MKAPSNLNPVQKETFALTAAFLKNTLSIEGDFVICLSADEDFEVAFNQSSAAVPLGANGQYHMPFGPDGTRQTFDQIEFRRKSGATLASNNVVVVIGSGDYNTGTITLAASVTSKSASTLNGATGDVVLVAVTNTLVVAANAARRCVRITNTGAVDARLSSVQADLTGGKGELLRAGEAREIFVNGNIYARSAGTPTLNVGEEIF